MDPMSGDILEIQRQGMWQSNPRKTTVVQVSLVDFFFPHPTLTIYCVTEVKGTHQVLKSSKTMRDLHIGSVSDLLPISRRFHAVYLPRKTYLTPISRRYFDGFMNGIDEKLKGGNLKYLLHMPP